MPNVDEIRKKAQQMAEKGIDARTIAVHFECVAGGPLKPAEAQAVIDGWKAAAPVRHQKHRERQQAAADALRAI